MAGIAAAEYLGYIDKTELDENLKSLDVALEGLRQGMFAPKNRGKLIEKTEEGIDISTTLLTKGYVADDEIERFPGVTRKPGVHPVMECTQNIPCNPCQDACPKKCIKIGEKITSLPGVDESAHALVVECAWLHVQVRQFSLLTKHMKKALQALRCRMSSYLCQRRVTEE